MTLRTAFAKDSSAAPGGHCIMSCQSQKQHPDSVCNTHSERSLYPDKALWHFVFGTDVHFACKIDAMIVSFPVGIVMMGVMTISVQV